jgi:hypothetical protein
MTILYINTGSSSNKGDGDPLRTAFNKINSNFRELSLTTPISFPDQSGKSGDFLSTVNGELRWVSLDTLTLSVQTTCTVVIDSVPPRSPLVGELWYDAVSGRTYVWYDTNWVDASPRGATGTILPNENGNAGKFLTTDGSNLSWASIRIPTAVSSLTNDIGYLTSSTVAHLSTQRGITCYF